MDVSHLLYFITASVLLTLAPGPDILFVIAQSVSHGRKAGIATALGLCSGITVHTLAAALGISALLYQSSTAFQILKYIGAAYLLFLAWQAFKERKDKLALKSVPKQQVVLLYRRGILMNVLNPKVALFFLAFLPQFVSPGTEYATLQMIMLGLIFMVQAVVIFTLVSLFAGSIGRKVLTKPGVAKYISISKAVLFALIALRLAFAEK